MRALNKQTIIPFVLFLLGLVLTVYGVGFHKMEVFPEEGQTAVASSEGALTREVTIGGVKLDELGGIRQTYTGKAPSACPT